MSFRDLIRKLRKNQTSAEQIFWNSVRNRQFEGIKFLRQYPIKFQYYDKFRFFIADFFCAKFKLIIEIDGKVHEKQKEYDEYRTYLLNNFDYKVVRFKNEDVVNDIQSVLKKLLSYINSPSFTKM